MAQYLLKNITSGFLLLIVMTTFASAEGDAIEQKDNAQTLSSDKEAAKLITQAFKIIRPEWQMESITPSRIAGLYRAQVLNGPVFYSSADGQHFIAGDLFQVTETGFVNLAEQDREGARAEVIASVNKEDMIIFSPKTPAKAFITVFTDIDCGFCRKLHNEVPALNELGVEVRYLAYPRAGLGSSSYNKIVTAWCADNRTEALTALKQGKTLTSNVCQNNPVSQHFKLGQQIGVTGTPAIVFESGQLLPGYMEANKLAALLDIK